MSRPTFRDHADFDLVGLSLGAGVQSTTLVLLAAAGELPKPDVAIFADTGWEPRGVYEHLARLERDVMRPAGIPLVRVQAGSLRDEAPDPNYPMARLPLFVDGDKPGRLGRTMRQCTPWYKIAPINRHLRKMLGGKVETIACPVCEGAGERLPVWLERQGQTDLVPCSQCHGTGERERVGPVPKGSSSLQWVGFSTDEVVRVAESRVGYSTLTFPLLDLDPRPGRITEGWSRTDCRRYLAEQGWGSTAKSACIGCPYHNNAMWRQMRDERPDEWADAVDFDRQIRDALPGKKSYLHRSGQPLELAPIDRLTGADFEQGDLLDVIAEAEEEPDSPGCSPFGCASDEPYAPLDDEAIA